MTILIKTSDTVRTNTTTLAADPDLQFSLSASTDYLIRGKLWFSGMATPGIKVAFTSGGATVTSTTALIHYADTVYAMAGNVSNPDAGPAILSAAPTARPIIGSDTADTRGFYLFESFCRIGGTGGTWAVSWAQNTVDAVNAATMEAGSCLEYITPSGSDLSVIKTADESRATAAAAVDSELVLALAADTYYWLDCCLFGTVDVTFARRLWCEWRYTGTVQAPHHLQMRTVRVATVSSGSNTSATMEGMFDQMMGTEFEIVSNTAGGRGGTTISGIIHTDTAGDLELWWRKSDNGGSPATLGTVFAGSYIIARPITDF